MERRRRIQFLPFHLYTRRTFNGNRWEIHKFIVTSPCRLTLREGKRKHYLVTVFQWDSFPVMLQKKRKKFSFKINFLFPFSFKITCFSYFTAFFLDLFCENFNSNILKNVFIWRITALQVCFISAVSQCESAMYIHISHPSWASLPPLHPICIADPAQVPVASLYLTACTVCWTNGKQDES